MKVVCMNHFNTQPHEYLQRFDDFIFNFGLEVVADLFEVHVFDVLRMKILIINFGEPIVFTIILNHMVVHESIFRTMRGFKFYITHDFVRGINLMTFLLQS